MVVKIWGYHESSIWVTRTRLQRLCRHISVWYGLLSLILDRFEYWGSSFKSRLSRLSFEQHCSNGKERLMKMPNIQYVCLSGSEVILTLSSYHFCWILSSLNSFSLQKNCSTGYSIRKEVCVLTLLCSGWGCWAGLHSWRSITLWCI